MDYTEYSRIKTLYQRFGRSYPLLGHILKRVRYRKFFNTVRKSIRGKGNLISSKNAILTNIVFEINGDDNRIEIQNGSVLNNVKFRITGNSHRILIMDHCHFDGGSIWFEDRNCTLNIGSKSTFGEVHFALTEPGSVIRVGKDCMFSSDVDVRTGDSHSILSTETGQRINPAEDVTIGDHVWVAAHCIILKGSHIPENSIIASGAVVSRRFDTSGVIIGGNPAKEIKGGVTWIRPRIYQNDIADGRLEGETGPPAASEPG